jgi:NADPH2:quinone reductase
MRAIVVEQFGPVDVMKLRELPTPDPGQGQVLVRLHAAGVNPVDTYIRSGSYAMKPPLPYTPGGDGAGVIEAIGTGVVGWHPGDRVYVGGSVAGQIFGLYATHAICAATQVHALPEHISFEQGAAVNVAYVTAYRALFDRAQLEPAETVLVHGASGGVGLAAVQLAAMHGAIVLGTAGSDAGHKLVTGSGASAVFDHSKPGYLEEIRRFVGEKGVDVIIEMLANVNLDQDLSLLGKFGRVVIVGNRGRVEIDPRQTMGKETAILGMQMWAGGDVAVQRAHAHIVAGLKSRTLNPIVGPVFPLVEAPKAHDAVMTTRHVGKVVLRCD